MFVFIGMAIVVGSVLGGYLMEEGNLSLLIQPAELIIIFGAAMGGFVISSPMKVIKAVQGGLLRMFKSRIYSEQRLHGCACPAERDILQDQEGRARFDRKRSGRTGKKRDFSKVPKVFSRIITPWPF